MHTTIYNKIHAGLLQIIPDLTALKDGGYRCSEVSGYMPLSLNVLHATETEIHLALAHNYKQNGDLVPDPDMEIRVYPKSCHAEALTFQDQSSFRRIYGDNAVDVPAKKSLNEFLLGWLENLNQQGHCLRATEASPSAVAA